MEQLNADSERLISIRRHYNNKQLSEHARVIMQRSRIKPHEIYMNQIT